MTDSNTVQCIPITIISDSTSETSEECFTYTISASSIVAGLTLSPITATICVSEDRECKYLGKKIQFLHLRLKIRYFIFICQP